MKGRSDWDGDDKKTLSIKRLMQLQNDFVHKVTLLQHHAKILGVILERSPKCHPELAGEGIEYAWGLSKLMTLRAFCSRSSN